VDETMSRIRFFLISFFVFIVTILGEGLFRKAITVSLCGIFALNSSVCSAHVNVDTDSFANAAFPPRNYVSASSASESEMLISSNTGGSCQDSTNDKTVSMCDITKMFEKARVSESSREGQELKKLYQELRGAAFKLDEYRKPFLKNGQDLMGVFPAFYYNVTVEELKRIANGDFQYPKEKMEQMVAFFEAYEINRKNWDSGNRAAVEPHWREHFVSADGTNADNEDVTTFNELFLAFRQGASAVFQNPVWVYTVNKVLSTGADAHVKHDLARALRYSLENRDRNASIEDLKKEFDCTEITLKSAGDKTLSDIFRNIIYEYVGNGFDRIILGTTEAVLSQRRQAWEDAIRRDASGTFEELRPSTIGDAEVLVLNQIQPHLSSNNREQLRQRGQDYLEKCSNFKEATSTGDPHLVTFDGLKYSFQTVGEYILVKASHGFFEVQARQVPFSSSLSVNSAIAIRVGDNRVALYARDFPDSDTSTPLRVNGRPTNIQGDKLAFADGGEVLKQGSRYVVSAPTGEKVLVSLTGSGNNAFLNVSPFAYERSGEYSGLLGNANGNPNDDLQIRNGDDITAVRASYGDVTQVLNLVGLRLPGVLNTAEKLYFDQLYKDFGNSWRVNQEESLFDYPAGKNSQSYLVSGFPEKYLTLNMLSADQIQQARNACTESNVAQDLMEGCIFDVGFSGLSDFALATAEISNYIGIVNQLFPGLNIPTPEQVVDRVIQEVRPRVCIPFVGCL